MLNLELAYMSNAILLVSANNSWCKSYGRFQTTHQDTGNVKLHGATAFAYREYVRIWPNGGMYSELLVTA